MKIPVGSKLRENKSQCGQALHYISLNFQPHLTLKMASVHDVETSVTTNSPSRDSFHPDDQIPSNDDEEEAESSV